MQITLVSVYDEPRAIDILYDILLERREYQSIWHREATFEQHKKYIQSQPYVEWFLIKPEQGDYVGYIHLNHHDTLGIFLFEGFTHQGYGTLAVQELLKRHPWPLYAEVNVANTRSIQFFEKLGFREKWRGYEYARAT